MPDNGASQAKPAPSTTNGAAAETKRQRVRMLISALGMLPVLLILCVGFHFLSEGRFFTGQNPASCCSRPR